MSKSKMKSSSEKLECKYCEYYTRKKVKLWNHMRRCSAKKSLKKCEICGHRTSDWQIHMYRHLKVPKLQVARLPEVKSRLIEAHETLKNKENKLKCSQCNFAAISRSRLVAHETLKHKENKLGKWIVKLDDSIIKEERKAAKKWSKMLKKTSLLKKHQD